MNNNALSAMREAFLEYSRNVIDRHPPFDVITAPTLYSRYEPYISVLDEENVNYKGLYIEIMAASICRACCKHEFLLEKIEKFEKAERSYSRSFADNYVPPLWPKPDEKMSISEIKAAIRGLMKSKLSDFSKDKSLDSNNFLYKQTYGNVTVWLMLTADQAVSSYFHASIGITDSKQRKILSLSDMSTLTDSDCHWIFSGKEELQKKFDIFLGLLGIVLPAALKITSQLIGEYGEDELFRHLE